VKGQVHQILNQTIICLLQLPIFVLGNLLICDIDNLGVFQIFQYFVLDRGLGIRSIVNTQAQLLVENAGVIVSSGLGEVAPLECGVVLVLIISTGRVFTELGQRFL
jgi:hypothetical protein